MLSLAFLQNGLIFSGRKPLPVFACSPYVIDFKLTVPESSKMELINVSVYSCADNSRGCSSDDSPLSQLCSNSEPPPYRKELCSIRIVSIEVGNDEVHIHVVLKFVDYVLLVIGIYISLC